MVEAELMLEVQVGIMQDVEEELVQKLVVQPVVGVAMKFVVGDMTGTRTLVLSVLAEIMRQRRISMWVRVQGNTVSKRLVSPGLAIVVCSSLFPSASSCCSHFFPCYITCCSPVPSRRHSHQHNPRLHQRRHFHMIATWGLRSSGRVAKRCIAARKWATKA